MRKKVVPQDRLFCGGEDQACCGPSPGRRSTLDPPFCNKTLGCNVTTNKCERPCGKVSQVCCDGPDTVAPRKGYSPNSPLLKPMCEASICDGATRRCVANCGMNAGDSCCRPQPPLAVATCINPSLICEYDDASAKTGICAPCGAVGEKPCAGTRCNPKLILNTNGICGPCGTTGLEPCDDGCAPNLIVDRRSGLCIPYSAPVPPSGGAVGSGSSPTKPPPSTKCECTPESTDPACGLENGGFCDPTGPRLCRPGMGCTRDAVGLSPYRCRPPDAFEAPKWNCPPLPDPKCWTKEQVKTLTCHGEIKKDNK